MSLSGPNRLKITEITQNTKLRGKALADALDKTLNSQEPPKEYAKRGKK